MANPYLKRLQDQYTGLRSGIEGLQTRAVDEDRDLTEDEFRSVQEDTAKAEKLFGEIETLTDFEARSAKVTALAASLPREPEDNKEIEKAEVRTVSNTTAIDRDPGHYRSVEDGGQHSFFADMFKAKALGDAAAKARLDEHTRAVVQDPDGAGILPPKWLTSEYMSLARQTRVVANAVRHLPLGRDPRPLVLPKQTAGVDPNIVTQTTEGENTAAWGVDRFATGTDTLTPVTYAAYQDVSRQLLDASDPAVDALIFGDLRAAWDQKIEAIVCAAILADGTAFSTVTETEFETDAAAIDLVIDAQVAVSEDLRGPADLAVMNFGRFGSFRKLKDGNNRPLMPVSRYNPQNANGALGNALIGDIEGVDVLASAGVPTAGTEMFAVLRSQAVILAESDTLDFTYDQVAGPSAVRMGIWGYVGTLVRNPGSVQVITVSGVS
jgi:HK97 family phage major capsid protein